MRAAYCDRTLVTRIGALHADHAAPHQAADGLPTSSSTLPSLVVQMYRHALIGDAHEVLDVATGSGYGAALLCRRLPERQVTTVDIDRYLTDAAAQRLDRVGLHPRVEARDATGPLPGTYDRIVSMVSVSPLPASWLAALRPGGRLVTTLARTSVIVVADKTDDGGAVGMTARDWAGFMATRDSDDYPPSLYTQLGDQVHEPGEHVSTGRYPVLRVDDAWELRSMLEFTVPGTESAYQEGPDGQRTAWLVHPDGSWARACAHHFDNPTVHQTGPRRLWDALERIRTRLNTAGGLPVYGVPLTITPDGTVHLKRGNWAATIGR
ncbi:methyltransferase domain-containing protein [Streptomyces sp. CBMA152]|uniref:methyltransferase domain-containing protein n=1 Tax=Streptomyces sp. CBMA152 TaxID=1896312 RepID=UPI001CB6D0F0|nr:methyltransferase domain-containing protein [Streptomyces sp. CBMA152]